MTKKKDPESKRLVSKTNEGYKAESIKIPKIVVEEERYNLEKDDSLIKYEFNFIELPFFTKDDRIGKNVSKKYSFSGTSYMQVTPSQEEESGHKIPQDFDEKIFYAILRLYRRYNRKRIVTTIYELLELAGAGVSTKDYDRVKESIFRLQGTSIKCSNILYNAEDRKRMSDTQLLKILQYARIVKVEDISAKDRADYKERIKANMKEVVVVELSDFIERNILAKGYLNYDAEKLIDIANATARKMYLLIEKWRGWEKSDIIRRSCRFLASRIPLSWEDKNVSGSIKSIEKAAQELKIKGLIGDYQLSRAGGVKDTEIIFFFEGATASARAQAIRKRNEEQIQETGHEGIQILDVTYDERQSTIFDSNGTAKDPDLLNEPSELAALIELVPAVSRTKSLQALIARYLKEKGGEYVSSNIEYCRKNARDFGGMLPGALQKDFGEGIRLARAAEEQERSVKKRAREQASNTEQERLAFEEWWRGLTDKEKAEVDIRAAEMAEAAGLSKTVMGLATVANRVKVYKERKKKAL
ncbi:MAG TPA: replication initiator protein A [bacterium]|nr:replication initiator protein A [bacterium]